jgi:fructose-1,6-bisphosphatase/inositol monophosphatase family enzyme
MRWVEIRNGEMLEVDASRTVDSRSFREAYFSEHGWCAVSRSSASWIRKANFYSAQEERPWGPLLRAGMETVREVIERIVATVGEDRARALAPARIGSSQKPVLAIDLIAECEASCSLMRYAKCYGYDGPRPVILGEESLHTPQLDVFDADGPVILHDTLDGSDELEQGFAGWCVAMTIFHPHSGEILAAFVGGPTQGIYFSFQGLAGRCSYHSSLQAVSPDIIDLDGPSSTTSLSECLLGVYAQKPSRLSAMYHNPRFLALLDAMQESGRARIRTQAGNPMMLRLVHKQGWRRFDAILDLPGQWPHDIAPGAIIALQKGATMLDLRSGRELDLVPLLCRPADPRSRVPYVIAATPELAATLCGLLAEPEGLRLAFLEEVPRGSHPELLAACA